MLRLRKSLLFVMIICLFSLFNPSVSQAVDLINSDAFWRSGFSSSTIGNAYVYESPSVLYEGYSPYVSNAKTQWSNISGANIGYSTTSVATRADIRVYAGFYPYDWAGEAQPYIGGNKVVYPDINVTWDFVVMRLNDGVMGDGKYSVPLEITKVVTHEFGHALGLRHQESHLTKSVMRRGKSPYYVPQSVDKSNVAWKY